MKWLKSIPFFVSFLLIPVLLGGKGCETGSSYQHPPLQKGQACADCHDDGRTTETKPKGHSLDWERVHGQWIQQNGLKSNSTCVICHKESWCTSCHQINKPRNHNEFWKLKGHGLMVGLDRSRCYACHRTDFCERCHANTTPMDHNAAWGPPADRHCLNCHFPLASIGAQRCAVCHTSAGIHASTPKQPNNSLHSPGANCRDCHRPLHHPDNGMNCTVCHTK